MIDQCIIFTVGDRVQINPDFLDHQNSLLDGWLPCLRRGKDDYAKHSPGEERLRHHSTFEIFADRALVVHSHSRQSSNPDRSRQYVHKIEINLRKILHGTNSISIRNDGELVGALCIALHAISLLLQKPSQAAELIPGINNNKHSYWRKLEVALDVRDPGNTIRKQMQRMKSPYISKPAILYPDNTYLKGTNLELKAYDKVEQTKVRFKNKGKDVGPSEDEITRLEVVIPKGILPRHFPTDRETIRTTFIKNQDRLTGFTWSDLVAIHRVYFKNIKGVYHTAAKEGSGYSTGHAAVLASLALDYDIPLGNIREATERYGARSKDASRKQHNEMLKFMEQASELSADTVLSDKAYTSPPLIVVSELEGAKSFVEHCDGCEIFKWLELVRPVYSERTSPTMFTPKNDHRQFWL
jgi:hypothetical protein